jgi:hypothetical protein
MEGMPQALAPARTDHPEVRVFLVDVDVAGHAQSVALDTQQVQRQSHRKVRAYGGVHRDQGAFRRLRQAGAARDHPIDDGLAVLRLADLEVRRIYRGFDEIACRVDTEQARRFGADLAAENEGGIELDVVFFQRFGIALVHLAQRIAHVARGLEHVGRVVERGGLALLVALAQDVGQRLGDGQVAGAHQHHDAFAGIFVNGQLAKRADLVHTGVGARIGQENQSRVHQHCDAISHEKTAPADV